MQHEQKDKPEKRYLHFFSQLDIKKTIQESFVWLRQEFWSHIMYEVIDKLLLD